MLKYEVIKKTHNKIVFYIHGVDIAKFHSNVHTKKFVVVYYFGTPFYNRTRLKIKTSFT